MADERKKVLEMLSEGKLTVDEAERLLSILEDDKEEPRRKRSRRRRSGDGFLGDLEQEIDAGISEAAAVIDEIGPELRSIFKESSWALRDKGRFRRRRKRQRREYRARHVRTTSDSRDIEKGTAVTVRNERGGVRFETWDRDSVSYEASIVARARTEEDAERIAEAVEIEMFSAERELRIETSLPNEDGELRGHWHVDLIVRLPEGSDVDLATQHGKAEVPNIEGDVNVRNAHGATSIGRISGALRVNQGHGSVDVVSAGGNASIDVRHGNLELEEAGSSLSLKTNHGNATLGTVRKDLDVFSTHGHVNLGTGGGSIRGRARHASLTVEKEVEGDVTLDSSHGSLRAVKVGGDLTSTVRHGSVTTEEVAGGVGLDVSHSPVIVRRVGKDLRIRSSHSHISIPDVAGDASIEASRGKVDVTGVEGRIEASLSRGNGRIGGMSATTVSVDRGSVAIIPDGPVTDDLRIAAHRSAVDLVLPEGSDLEIHGSLERSEVWCTVPGIEKIEAGRSTTLAGRVGSGEASLDLSVVKGPVRIANEESSDPLGLDHGWHP